jgi:hypothetical protein
MKLLVNLSLVLFLLIFNTTGIKITKIYEVKQNTKQRAEYLKKLVVEIEEDYQAYYKEFYSGHNSVSLTMNFDTLAINNSSNINRIIDRKNEYQKELNILNDILKINKESLCRNLNNRNIILTKELSLKKEENLHKLNKNIKKKFSLEDYLKENRFPEDPCNYLIDKVKLKKINLESEFNYLNNKIDNLEKERYERDERLRIALVFFLTTFIVILFIFLIRNKNS